MRVQAAGIGKRPQQRLSEALYLPPAFRMMAMKRLAIRLKPQHGDNFGAILERLGEQTRRASFKLFASEFSRLRGGAFHKIRDAAAAGEQFLFFKWRKKAWREACRMNDLPETVSRMREMMADCRRIQARIYAAEQYV